MATRLMDKVFVKGGYLDSNVSVTSISELIDKYDFDGQSVHMPEAFLSTDEVPYPVDFWYIPNGDDIKWEIKTIPSIASLEDFEKFKDFIGDFESQAGYYPIANGTKVLVNGENFIFGGSNEEGGHIWEKSSVGGNVDIEDIVDEVVKTAVDNITSGASEAFDTLKEIEDWISNHGDGNISEIEALKKSAHTHENKDILDNITDKDIEMWDNASKAGGTTLDESIVVTRDAGNYKNGMTIEEGTSVLEVLKNFLSTTQYPSIATKPSARMIVKTELQEEYEIGALIEIPEVSIETISGNYNYDGYNGEDMVGGDFYEVKLRSNLVNGFSNYMPNREYVDNIIYSQSAIVVTEGVNEIIIDGYAKYNAPINMPTTSDGTPTKQTGSTSTDNSATWDSGEIVLTKTFKVNGYRNVYFGTTDSDEPLTGDLIKSLNASNKSVTDDTILETVTEDSKNHNRMIIAVPEGKTLKLVEDSTSTQDLTKLLSITEKKIEILSENGEETVIYNVYDKAWAGSFGNETWFIKIKNK